MEKSTGQKILILILPISLWGIMSLQGQDLRAYRWENRILMIKSSEGNLTKHQRQIDEIQNLTHELAERKLIIFQIIGNKYKSFNYLDKSENEDNVSSLITENIFKREEEFEVILIGLDGGIKLRKKEILYPEELFSIIDAMPMRRNEIRSKKSTK